MLLGVPFLNVYVFMVLGYSFVYLVDLLIFSF